MPNQQNARRLPRPEHGAERGKIGSAKKIPIAVLSDHHARNGDQVQPETKSDFV